MSWARGILNGREVGYAVTALCDAPGCPTGIDRGLDFRCGGANFDEGCGGYFCHHHLAWTDHGQRCDSCAAPASPTELGGEAP